ncbi:hypothetical protein ACJ41O_004926 [Fusarium nematophilum]
MTYTVPLTAAWPATASALRDLLGIDPTSSPVFKCHGRTQEGLRCKNDIGQAKVANLGRLLDRAVQCGGFEAGRALLSEVANLIMCWRPGHQIQGPPRFSTWEGKFKLLQSPRAKVEDQEDGSAAPGQVLRTEAPKTPRPASHRDTDAKADDPAARGAPSSKLRSLPSTPTKTSRKSGASESTPSSSKDATVKHHFENFSLPRSTTFINKKIRALLLRPLLEKEKPSDGQIYIYTFPSEYRAAAPYLKIGFAQDVAARMARWKNQCGYSPQVLGQLKAENYAKVEKLVHAQFLNQRKREMGCPTCGVWHKEWFSVSSMEALKIVGLWTSWTRREPYDEAGRLKEKWRARVESVDLTSPDCWEVLVNGVYDEDDDGSELSEEDSFQWSSDDQSQHSGQEEIQLYDTEDEYDDEDKWTRNDRQ